MRRLTPQPLPAWVPRGDGPLLVVTGGAKALLGPTDGARNFAQAPESGRRVVHLTGGTIPRSTRWSIRIWPNAASVTDIPGLLQHADLAISRAGAGSLSELAVCGTPTVLVPFPQAADRHQDANAACAASFGAAVIVHQHDPNHSVLAKTIQRLLGARLGKADVHRQLLQQMQQGMEQLAERDADQQLARYLQLKR